MAGGNMPAVITVAPQQMVTFVQDPTISDILKTEVAGQERILLHERISDRACGAWAFLGPPFWANLFGYADKDGPGPRAYIKVSETTVTVNYPHYTWCCSKCCVDDWLYAAHLDTNIYARKATGCTPYHLFGCIPLCGGVVAVSKYECCNNCFCNYTFPCCVQYLPGFKDDQEDRFVNAINAGKARLYSRFPELVHVTSAPAGAQAKV